MPLFGQFILVPTLSFPCPLPTPRPLKTQMGWSTNQKRPTQLFFLPSPHPRARAPPGPPPNLGFAIGAAMPIPLPYQSPGAIRVLLLAPLCPYPFPTRALVPAARHGMPQAAAPQDRAQARETAALGVVVGDVWWCVVVGWVLGRGVRGHIHIIKGGSS